jgi:hypothetical protein
MLSVIPVAFLSPYLLPSDLLTTYSLPPDTLCKARLTLLLPQRPMAML